MSRTFQHCCVDCRRVYYGPLNARCPTCDPVVEELPDPLPDHDGSTYSSVRDKKALNRQARRVFALMSDGKWRTLEEISEAVGDPEASVSARLRDFRKEKWGGYTVQRRLRFALRRGLYEYRLDLNSGCGGY